MKRKTYKNSSGQRLEVAEAVAAKEEVVKETKTKVV